MIFNPIIVIALVNKFMEVIRPELGGKEHRSEFPGDNSCKMGLHSYSFKKKVSNFIFLYMYEHLYLYIKILYKSLHDFLVPT